MKRKDFFLALMVVIIWGANFTVVKLGLGGIPSMLLVALRYLLTFFPAIFIVKKPNTQWKYILLYGFTVGVGQFSALFYALEIGMPAGLSSILLQLQAFISPILGYLLLKEGLKTKQVVGFIIAATGLFIIGLAADGTEIHSIPIVAILLTVLAAFFWASSNIVAKIASQKALPRGRNWICWGWLFGPVWCPLFPC